MSSEIMNQETNEQPIEGTPASGQNDEASRGESLPPPTTEFVQQIPVTVGSPAPVPVKKPKKPKKRSKSDEMMDAAQEVLDAVEEAREKAGELQAALDEARDELEAAIEAVGEKLENLRSLREDLYQGWYDNMNEGLQQSPTGEKLRALLEDIDLEPSMPEVPELEEISFDDVESAAQQIMEAEFPQGFGRD